MAKISYDDHFQIKKDLEQYKFNLLQLIGRVFKLGYLISKESEYNDVALIDHCFNKLLSKPDDDKIKGLTILMELVGKEFIRRSNISFDSKHTDTDCMGPKYFNLVDNYLTNYNDYKLNKRSVHYLKDIEDLLAVGCDSYKMKTYKKIGEDIRSIQQLASSSFENITKKKLRKFDSRLAFNDMKNLDKIIKQLKSQLYKELQSYCIIDLSKTVINYFNIKLGE